MRVPLKEFQTVAVEKTIGHLRSARRDARDSEQEQAVILAAPTGSGKTIIATATIERILFGSEGIAPDPRAVFLWITDQPQLNEQTRRKFLSTSSQLGPDRLIVLDDAFDEASLQPGRTYFLNTQKLGTNARLVKATDERLHTFWEIANNTIEDPDHHLYVVIDEAHRGMVESRAERERATSIMQRFIKGDEEMRPSPVILGITATPERFRALLAGTTRTTRIHAVKPEEVRESGLIKEKVVVFHPSETQPSDVTLLRQAAKDLLATGERWAEYCEGQGEALVRPLLIVQVEDGLDGAISRTDLGEAVAAIRAELGPTPDLAFGHAFQEGAPIAVGATGLRYVAPADISEDDDLKVVFFKTSLNTGWDCPQAEVMMSFRKAVDYTNIAQLVGRMVRAPLARRIDEDEQLNTVSLYLPHYDEAALKRVIEYLTESGEAAGAVEVETEPPVVMKRAPQSEGIFEVMAKIPSYQLPRTRKVSDVRRLLRLARNLSRDLIAANANEHETADLVALLVGEHERLSADDDYNAVLAERGTLTVRRVDWEVGAMDIEEDELEIEVSAENVNDLFAAAGRRLGEGLHEAYWKARVSSDPNLLRQARLEIVALAGRDDLNRKLGDASRTRVRELLDEHAPAISGLPERRRQVYDEIRGLSAVPELSRIAFPETIEVRPAEARWPKHAFVDRDGLAPFRLNSWEERVIQAEVESPAVISWVRNIDRKKWALLVPYEANGEAKPLFPDFLVVREIGQTLLVDVLDPHDPSLADAPAKAQGLAKFAQAHGPAFGRIETIAEVGGSLRRLDLKDEQTRQRVFAAVTPAHLRALFD
jgi:type III restriction enzyme